MTRKRILVESILVFNKIRVILLVRYLYEQVFHNGCFIVGLGIPHWGSFTIFFIYFIYLLKNSFERLMNKFVKFLLFCNK